MLCRFESGQSKSLHSHIGALKYPTLLMHVCRLTLNRSRQKAARSAAFFVAAALNQFRSMAWKTFQYFSPPKKSSSSCAAVDRQSTTESGTTQISPNPANLGETFSGQQ